MYNFDEIIDRTNTNTIKHDKLTAVFGTEDVLSMWVADMDFRTPDFIIKKLKERLEHEVLGYTFRGESFFDAVVGWLKKMHGWEVKKDWVTFSPGVVPALTIIINAFTQPGDKVILQSPVYYPFFTSISDTGRQLINNQLVLENGKYKMDFEDLKRQIDSRTKMILLCSPHNPASRVWSKEELTELAEICVKNNIIIVADEIHSDIILTGHKHIPIASISEEISDLTISTYAPSKTFNLAGLSTSVVVTSNRRFKATYDNYIGNFHLHMGNIFGAIALEEAYTKGEKWLTEMINYIEGNIELVRQFADKHADKMQMIEPEATYLLWLDFSKMKLTDEQLKKFMIKKARLGFNHGPVFGAGGEGFQRMNVACSRLIVEKALERLQLAYNSL